MVPGKTFFQACHILSEKSVPGSSAEYVPKIPYLERIPKVRDLCDLLAKRVDPVFMGWEFLITRKR